jgi:UDP-N-acetylmuramate--alanine ligase
VGAQETFGIEEGDLRATGLRLADHGSSFTVDGTAVQLRVPGRHNVLNALAALAGCRAVGVSIAEAAPTLGAFTGAKRRFEHRGTTDAGVEVYDDYAHHPTEVRATLEAARTLGGRRLIAVFQPHLYSRTRMLARDFGRALSLADSVAVLDVYPARERAEDYPGVSGLMVARAAADAARGRRVYWTPAHGDAVRAVQGIAGPGDVVVTLGAGDVDAVAARLTE